VTSITSTIAALTGEEAIRVLADTADYQHRLPDPGELRALETGLRQATAHDTGLADYAQPSTTANPKFPLISLGSTSQLCRDLVNCDLTHGAT
jgi:hypothetical protein